MRARWRLSWLFDLVLPLMALTAELLWVSLWLRVVFRLEGGAGVLPFATILLVGGLGTLLRRAAVERAWQLERLRWSIMLGGALAAVVVSVLTYRDTLIPSILPFLLDPLLHVPPAVMALVVAAVAWWRGVHAGDRPIDTLEAEDRFRVGVIALVLLALAGPALSQFADTSAIGADLPATTLLYFALSLTVLSIARLQALRSRNAAATSGTVPRWGATLASTVAAILGLGIILVAILPREYGLLGQVLRPVVQALSLLDPVVVILLWPFAWFLENVLFRLFHYLSLMGLQNILNIAPAEDQQQPPKTIQEWWGQGVVTTIEWLMLLLVAAIALYFIWNAIRRRRKRPVPDTNETREIVWSWRHFFASIRSWLIALFKRPRAVDAAIAVQHTEPETVEVRSIRELYRQFLASVKRAGYPRRTADTPLELLGRIESVLPASLGDAEHLTEAYNRVRYGDVSLPADDVDLLRAGMENITRELFASSNNSHH